MSKVVSRQRGRRAVFLDRDGTINVEKDYLVRSEDFEFLPGAPEAIRRLRDAGFLIIVVTNQSGVARGFFSEEEVAVLHRHLQEELAHHHTRVDAFYHCPHHPTHGVGVYRVACDCRKGEPGMLLAAAADHGLELAHCYMVGDKPSDIEAGERAGCTSILVKTGYGSQEQDRIPAGTPVVADLPAAADWILSREASRRND